MIQAKKASRAVIGEELSGQGLDWAVRREARLGVRGFRGESFEELKNPNPVSGAGLQFFAVCSTPMRVRYRVSVARWFQQY
jgi:hypothetical protein